MGDFTFLFVDDELVDADEVFIQNVDHFLFSVYFGYLDRYDSEIKKDRNDILSYVLRHTKTIILMGEVHRSYLPAAIES